MKIQRFLDGVGIRGFRGIGPELQTIGPFKEINLFVGVDTLSS
jgi:hypothetical protein